MEKQKMQIWEAVRQGADTSIEIADLTGLSVAHVCNYLPELIEAGLVRRTGRLKRSAHGRELTCYEPARERDYAGADGEQAT